MTLLKIISITTLLWLTACSSTPLSAPPVARDAVPPAAQAQDGIALQSSRNLGSAQPTPTPHASPVSTPVAASVLTPVDIAASAALARPDTEHTPLAVIDIAQAPSRVVTSLVPPVDLWDRIRRGYAMPDLQNNLVQDREQWYVARPDYIFRMTDRSKKYLFHIVEELELRNMPTELALLPFIESAFNPQAVSGAKAAGMWQFMPATGKYFELKQNAFRDDRRDVLASTRAALDYLDKLYGMFGDWHLALAAYNWGEGSVGRAIAKNQRAGLPTGYPDLNMPMETRFYVPKLQAIKNIVSQPDVFNAKLPLIENHPYFETVTIRRDMDVTIAARLAEISLEDFKALNPSVNRPVILAAGTPQILLPWKNAEIFQTNLDAYSGGRLATWTVWMAPSTMHPAEVAKRVGMSEAELRHVNAIPPRMVVRAGSSLLVPRSSSMQVDVSEKVADNGQLSLGPEIVLKRTVVRARKGDNVASMARRYKVNAEQMAQWNKTSVSARFKPRQQVVVMIAVRATGATARAASGPISAPHKVAAHPTAPRQAARTKTAQRAVAAKPMRRAAASKKTAVRQAPPRAKATKTRVAKR
ncbi:MAG: transglycosylase SLT domain-containing protein [Burkholderiales bacterium]|nr:transglycosylase SLT domain-containing protein [Burkholderiales bacterium]